MRIRIAKLRPEQALYLGDGAYVQVDQDGGGIILSTGSHKLREAENTIYLGPEVLQSLLEFLQAQRVASK